MQIQKLNSLSERGTDIDLVGSACEALVFVAHTSVYVALTLAATAKQRTS
jgi:hypothetical protein